MLCDISSTEEETVRAVPSVQNQQAIDVYVQVLILFVIIRVLSTENHAPYCFAILAQLSGFTSRL